MSQAHTLKEKVAKLYSKSNELQVLQQEISALKTSLLTDLKTQGQTHTTFDFADKQIKYHKYTDRGQISQKILREVLREFPEIDRELFMSKVLDCRTVTEKESIDIIKKPTRT